MKEITKQVEYCNYDRATVLRSSSAGRNTPESRSSDQRDSLKGRPSVQSEADVLLERNNRLLLK